MNQTRPYSLHWGKNVTCKTLSCFFSVFLLLVEEPRTVNKTSGHKGPSQLPVKQPVVTCFIESLQGHMGAFYGVFGTFLFTFLL